jgi:ribonuclease D
MKINLHVNDLPYSVNLKGDIAIDTEAMGLNNLRDRLCIVQICDENGEIHLVQFKKNSDGKLDYSAPNLRKVILDKSRQKIFHYARFDVAIICHYLKIEKIENIFCTKIASKLARTYTDHHGLRTLVGEICKIDLKKEQQSSNWGADEISEDQKKYAANDVAYLHRLRDTLISMLVDSERLSIAHEYFNFLQTITNLDLIGFNGSDLFNH